MTHASYGHDLTNIPIDRLHLKTITVYWLTSYDLVLMLWWVIQYFWKKKNLRIIIRKYLFLFFLCSITDKEDLNFVNHAIIFIYRRQFYCYHNPVKITIKIHHEFSSEKSLLCYGEKKLFCYITGICFLFLFQAILRFFIISDFNIFYKFLHWSFSITKFENTN